MKEHPLLFSTPMVKAILNSKKTMTRRIVKPQPIDNREIDGNFFDGNHKGYVKCDGHPDWQRQFALEFCPYGKPGEILFVRENWKIIAWSWEDGEATFEYADGERLSLSTSPTDAYDEKSHQWLINHIEKLIHDGYYSPASEDPKSEDEEQLVRTDKHYPFKPSIHLPKFGSRIWLEVVNVRIEMLHDITWKDVLAEGVDNGKSNPTMAFEELWNSINGNWNENPWVWVVEFKLLSTTGKSDIR